VLIGKDGKLLSHHRKLIPSAAERLVWSRGAGDGLKVVDTELGKVGGLICWENYMPAARLAMYQQGIEYVPFSFFLPLLTRFPILNTRNAH
jgi:predicted amidohydrolase